VYVTAVAISILLITSFLSEDMEGTILVYMFAAFAAAHYLFFVYVYTTDLDVGGGVYYGTALMLDMAVLICARFSFEVTPIAFPVFLICGLSMVVNMLGWLSWIMYIPVYIYNNTYSIVYILFIAISIYSYRTYKRPRVL